MPRVSFLPSHGESPPSFTPRRTLCERGGRPSPRSLSHSWLPGSENKPRSRPGFAQKVPLKTSHPNPVLPCSRHPSVTLPLTKDPVTSYKSTGDVPRPSHPTPFIQHKSTEYHPLGTLHQQIPSIDLTGKTP